MFTKIVRLMKRYDEIVIARHIGVDPDALSSQLALKEAILLLNPKKKVYAIGNGSSKFHYIGKLDKLEGENHNRLLIVLDTPDLRRIDSAKPSDYADVIKIDHHPFVDDFGGIEWIDETSSSTCQMILELMFQMKLPMNEEIARKLFLGLVSDTNRFAFRNSTAKTFLLVSKLLDRYPLDIEAIYQTLYMRPLSEVRLQGYISEHLTVTKHGVGYVKLTGDIIRDYGVDAGSAGNMVNNFNYIEEVLVWLTISQDVKNDFFKINIRSRGPEVNKIAERYHGGGHKAAAGARVTTMEEIDSLIEELDDVCSIYLNKEG